MSSLECFRSEFPSEWGYINFNEEYSLQEIPKRSSLYKSLNKRVNGSYKGKTQSIVRIVNPYLYLQFHLKREEFIESRGQASVVELFHDTGASKIDSIAQHNLDYRCASRVKFGKGVSFSPCPNYANKQSSRSNGTSRAMIIADVLIGNMQKISKSIKLPSVGYDTTVNYNGNVYVKYYDNEYYPKYVVYYKNASGRKTGDDINEFYDDESFYYY